MPSVATSPSASPKYKLFRCDPITSSALEELAHDRADDGAPKTVALLVTLLVDRLELRVEALDQLVELRLLRAAGTIDAAGLLDPTGIPDLLAEAGYAAWPAVATAGTTPPERTVGKRTAERRTLDGRSPGRLGLGHSANNVRRQRAPIHAHVTYPAAEGTPDPTHRSCHQGHGRKGVRRPAEDRDGDLMGGRASSRAERSATYVKA